MTKTIVNLTIPTVTQQIEQILATYAYHPYQQAFAIPDLRQELVAYVLSRVANCYVVADAVAGRPKQTPILPTSEEENLCRERLIHQGIQHVLHRNSTQINTHIPQKLDPNLIPSNWFG